ncbi:MAG: GNAT family N-acetyltransferase [Bdellovibrionota bacterium]
MFAAEKRQDFDRIHLFFDHLLRAQSGCRLKDEFPLIFGNTNTPIISINPKTENYLSGKLLASFEAGSDSQILILEENEQIKAGLCVLIREIEILPDQYAKFCFVGSVVTHPGFRQQGHQKDLFHVLSNACFQADLDFIVLWSNQLDFYHKLGFFLGGVQVSWSNQIPIKIAKDEIQVQFSDAANLAWRSDFFKFFEQKRMRSKRTEEEMSKLFRIPRMKVFYTDEAYALVGKGEDFQDICHEWAGSSEHVLACLQAAWREQPDLRILSPGVLHSPDELAVVEALEKNAFESRLEYLGLLRILSPKFKKEDFDPHQLKYPFFIWGLDSI